MKAILILLFAFSFNFIQAQNSPKIQVWTEDSIARYCSKPVEKIEDFYIVSGFVNFEIKHKKNADYSNSACIVLDKDYSFISDYYMLNEKTAFLSDGYFINLSYNEKDNTVNKYKVSFVNHKKVKSEELTISIPFSKSQSYKYQNIIAYDSLKNILITAHKSDLIFTDLNLKKITKTLKFKKTHKIVGDKEENIYVFDTPTESNDLSGRAFEYKVIDKSNPDNIVSKKVNANYNCCYQWDENGILYIKDYSSSIDILKYIIIDLKTSKRYDLTVNRDVILKYNVKLKLEYIRNFNFIRTNEGLKVIYLKEYSAVESLFSNKYYIVQEQNLENKKTNIFFETYCQISTVLYEPDSDVLHLIVNEYECSQAKYQKELSKIRQEYAPLYQKFSALDKAFSSKEKTLKDCYKNSPTECKSLKESLYKDIDSVFSYIPSLQKILLKDTSGTILYDSKNEIKITEALKKNDESLNLWKSRKTQLDNLLKENEYAVRVGEIGILVEEYNKSKVKLNSCADLRNCKGLLYELKEKSGKIELHYSSLITYMNFSKDQRLLDEVKNIIPISKQWSEETEKMSFMETCTSVEDYAVQVKKLESNLKSCISYGKLINCKSDFKKVKSEVQGIYDKVFTARLKIKKYGNLLNTDTIALYAGFVKVSEYSSAFSSYCSYMIDKIKYLEFESYSVNYEKEIKTCEECCLNSGGCRKYYKEAYEFLVLLKDELLNLEDSLDVYLKYNDIYQQEKYQLSLKKKEIDQKIKEFEKKK